MTDSGDGGEGGGDVRVVRRRDTPHWGFVDYVPSIPDPGRVSICPPISLSVTTDKPV